MSEFIDNLPQIAAVIGALLALFGMLAPKAIARLVGIATVAELKHSISEVRATYGGFFFGLHVYAFVLDAPAGYALLAAGWLTAGAVRLASMVLDRAFSSMNGLAAVFELAMAFLFIAPVWLANPPAW